jgi:hypothetical protein
MDLLGSIYTKLTKPLTVGKQPKKAMQSKFFLHPFLEILKVQFLCFIFLLFVLANRATTEAILKRQEEERVELKNFRKK